MPESLTACCETFPPLRWGINPGLMLSGVRSGKERHSPNQGFGKALFRSDEADHQPLVERGVEGHLNSASCELYTVIFDTCESGDGQGSSDEQSSLDPASDGLACHGKPPFHPYLA